MQPWSRVGLQVAVVAGGVLVCGTGIAAAAECCPQRPTTPLDAGVDVPVRLCDVLVGTPADELGPLRLREPVGTAPMRTVLGPLAGNIGPTVDPGSTAEPGEPTAEPGSVSGDTVVTSGAGGTMVGNVIAGPITLPFRAGADPVPRLDDLADAVPHPAFPSAGHAVARPVQLPAAASGAAPLVGRERAAEVTDVFPRITEAAPSADGAVPVQIFDAAGALLLVTETVPTREPRLTAEGDLMQKIVKGRDLPGSGPTSVPTLSRLAGMTQAPRQPEAQRQPEAPGQPEAEPEPRIEPQVQDDASVLWDGEYDDAPSGSALSTVDMEMLFGPLAAEQQPIPVGR